MFRKFFCIAASVLLAAQAWAAEWMNDWEAAKARAEREGKLILVNFTGSDWCVYCVRMREAVFDTPEFEAYVQDKFVLMEVDMPREHPQPEALSRQNHDLCRQYMVQGFPTVIVVAPDGQLLGGFPGAVMDMRVVQGTLNTALENKRLFDQAMTLESVERAHTFYSIYNTLPDRFKVPSGLGERILADDPHNLTGYGTELEVSEQWAGIDRQLEDAGTDVVKIRAVVEGSLPTALPPNRVKLEAMLAQLDFCEIYRVVEELSSEPEKAVAYLESVEANVPEGILGEILALKAEMQIQAAHSVDDILAAKASMERSYIYNSPPPNYRAYQDRRFSDPAALLENVERSRRH